LSECVSDCASHSRQFIRAMKSHTNTLYTNVF